MITFHFPRGQKKKKLELKWHYINNTANLIIWIDDMWGSSLIYNTSARNERHERHKYDMSATQATRVRLEQHKCKASATQVLHKWHKCNTSVARTTRVWHEWKILNLIMTRVKTYFHTPVFTTRKMKDYKERNNFILRTTFLEMPRSHAKMSLKSASQKRSILMTKAASKKFVAASL